MAEQVMVYEVKSSAAQNAKELFSNDKKYFYWNDKAFKKIKKDDYVFVVNMNNKEVLFTKLDKIDIPIKVDNDLTKFQDNGQTFKVEGKYDTFIRLEILDSKKTSNQWVWSTLGSGENTYLSDKKVDRNRIKRIAQIMELFVDSDLAKTELKKCYKNQFKINEIKDFNWFKERLESTEFYFAKAKEVLEEFNSFTLKNDQYDLLIDFFENRKIVNGNKIKYREVVENIQDLQLKEFALCLGKFITYLDTKADNKHNWNEYDPPRSIARAGIWMGNWIRNLVQYKKNNNSFDNISLGIVNAINYISDPINNAPIVSESHKEQMIRNFSNGDYNPETFADDLIAIFKKGDIISELEPSNDQNLTLLLMSLLYHDEIQLAWSDYLSGFFFNDENFKKDLLLQELNEQGYAEQVFINTPKGGNETLNYLSKKLEEVNGIISIVIDSNDKFDVLYANDFYTVKKSKDKLVEYGNFRAEHDIGVSPLSEFEDQFKLKIVGYTSISKDELDLEDFTFLKPYKKSSTTSLTPFVSPDLENYKSDQLILKPESNSKNNFAKTIDSNDMINHVFKYIQQKGFNFKKEEIANFYLSLKTKPFVILTGISGTGKTQLPRLFAEAVGMSKEQVIQVPVRPDWTDSSDLIGYTSLNEKFISKPLTDAILEANKEENRLKPHFFILDEMNLARVEHYFADFLSVIETRSINDNHQIITDPLISKSQIKDANYAAEFEGMYWPENLYLIGTVNMDETTHPFSRKVLDRANSIEMNTVELDWVEPGSNNISKLDNFSNSILKSQFIGSIDLDNSDKKSVSGDLELLKEVNNILKIADLHFAYRVRDEIIFYLLYARKEKLLKDSVAIDFQLMQKVLPRIHGSSIRTQKVLVGLINKLASQNYAFDYPDMSDISNNKEKIIEASLYPKSVTKLLFMLERFDEDRFTSFWI